MMAQKKLEELNHKLNIDTVLECLWAIRDKDKFYFMAYGKEMIENIINQKLKKMKPNRDYRKEAEQMFNETINKPMTYTKQERNVIYKKILADFDRVQASHNNAHLSFEVKTYFLTNKPQLDVEDFPEIIKHQPKDYFPLKYQGYWFKEELCPFRYLSEILH